jgi:hypothetical protein
MTPLPLWLQAAREACLARQAKPALGIVAREYAAVAPESLRKPQPVGFIVGERTEATKAGWEPFRYRWDHDPDRRISYPEVDLKDHRDLEEWWDGVSKRRKQVVTAAIEREIKQAAVWLAKAEKGLLRKQKGERLPQDGDGRDSGHIQPYRCFVKHDTRDLGVDVNYDDRDGVSYAEEIPIDKKASCSLVEKWNQSLVSVHNPMSGRVTSTFDEIESSGPLRSSWGRIEEVLGTYFTLGGKRKQWRYERKTPPDFPLRQSTRMAWDGKTGIFREVLGIEFNPYSVFTPDRATTQQLEDLMSDGLTYTQAALRVTVLGTLNRDNEGLDYERWLVRKKSPRRVSAVPDTNTLEPTKPVTYPTGPVREWADSGYREWLDSGDYDSLVAFRQRIYDRLHVTQLPRKVSKFAVA